MSADQNPNNYTGITATIVGRTGAAPDYPKYDKSKSGPVKEVRIAVDQGYKDKKTDQWVSLPTLWVSYFGLVADIDGLGLGKGDKVRIDDARLEAREFDRNDGSKGQAFEARYGEVTVVESNAKDEDF